MSGSKADLARLSCLMGCMLLVCLYAVKTLLLWPKALDTRLVIFALQLLPFAVLLPGLLQQRWRTFTWLCFVLLLYFMNAVLTLFEPQPRLIDWLVLLTVVMVFIAAMLYIRWRRVEVES